MSNPLRVGVEVVMGLSCDCDNIPMRTALAKKTLIRIQIKFHLLEYFVKKVKKMFYNVQC